MKLDLGILGVKVGIFGRILKNHLATQFLLLFIVHSEYSDESDVCDALTFVRKPRNSKQFSFVLRWTSFRNNFQKCKLEKLSELQVQSKVKQVEGQ